MDSRHIAIWFLEFVFSHHVHCFSDFLVLLLRSYFPDCLVHLHPLVSSLWTSFRLISCTYTFSKFAVFSSVLHISSCLDFGCVVRSVMSFSTHCDLSDTASYACVWYFISNVGFCRCGVIWFLSELLRVKIIDTDRYHVWDLRFSTAVLLKIKVLQDMTLMSGEQFATFWRQCDVLDHLTRADWYRKAICMRKQVSSVTSQLRTFIVLSCLSHSVIFVAHTTVWTV